MFGFQDQRDEACCQPGRVARIHHQKHKPFDLQWQWHVSFLLQVHHHIDPADKSFTNAENKVHVKYDND